MGQLKKKMSSRFQKEKDERDPGRASQQNNTGYKFLGWYDENGIKLSATSDHSFTIEPYYSTSDKDNDDQSLKKLQCTECHRLINMRYCSACGHEFKDEGIDAHMEIPGVNVYSMNE